MNDEYFMKQALQQAAESLMKGEIPVGAVLVSGGEIVTRAHNEPISSNDPTAHAEIVAIRKACQGMNNYRLPECELYVTLEPCPMCLAAMLHSRIKRLVYGAPDPKSGAVNSVMRFPFDRFNHRLDVKGGVLAEECRKILQEFFQARR